MDLPSDILREIILYSNANSIMSFRLCSGTVLKMCSDASFWSEKFIRDGLHSIALSQPLSGVDRLKDYIRSKYVIQTVKLTKSLMVHLKGREYYNIYIHTLTADVHVDMLPESVRAHYNFSPSLSIVFSKSNTSCNTYYYEGIRFQEFESSLEEFNRQMEMFMYYHPTSRIEDSLCFPIILKDIENTLSTFGTNQFELTKRREFLKSEIVKFGWENDY